MNGRAIVTGAHAFTPDVVRPGLLIGRVIRPERIGAALVSIDDSRVRSIAGASVVRDGEFVGVVAPNERAAREAALAVRAEWKPLEGQPSSDTIYEHLKKGGAGGRNVVPPSLAGDVAAARAAAARTFDAAYRIPYVNPDGLRNQVEGCVVQGLGGALFERVEFRDGVIVNGTMEQYRVPRVTDVPPIEIVLLDPKDLPSAGAGETPIVCVAPAIGSAARAFGEVAAELPVRLA